MVQGRYAGHTVAPKLRLLDNANRLAGKEVVIRLIDNEEPVSGIFVGADSFLVQWVDGRNETHYTPWSSIADVYEYREPEPTGD